jgi:hypothetical protein
LQAQPGDALLFDGDLASNEDFLLEADLFGHDRSSIILAANLGHPLELHPLAVNLTDPFEFQPFAAKPANAIELQSGLVVERGDVVESDPSGIVFAGIDDESVGIGRIG